MIRYYCTVIFIVSGMCLLYINFNSKTRIFTWLSQIGKMTLTNYLAQNVLIFFLFSGSGFGLVNKLNIKVYYLIALTVYFIQIVFSNWWLKKYQFGPVEWLWRCISYEKWIRNKRFL
jgi:uncharacterized protein